VAVLDGFTDLIADEVNVKSVRLSTDVASIATRQLQVVPAALGPRLGSATQQVIKGVKTGDWTVDGDRVTAGGIDLQPGEYTLGFVAPDNVAMMALDDGAGIVVLDVEVTSDLEAEGVARDLIRLVQQARRDAGLDVSDRITLSLGVDAEHRGQMTPHLDTIAAETLATGIEWVDSDPATTSLEGRPIRLHVERHTI
jgi:isoleucyl-tRNA synthetase